MDVTARATRRLRTSLTAAAVLATVALAVAPAAYGSTPPGYTGTLSIDASNAASIAVDPELDEAFVNNGPDMSEVVVVGLSPLGVKTTVRLPSGSDAGIAVDRASQVAYVPTVDGTVVEIDAARAAVTGVIRVGTVLDAVAVDPSTHTVYGAAGYGDAVVAIDETSHQVVGTVAVGNDPVGIAVDPGTHAVYVANRADNSLTVLGGAAHTVLATVAVGREPTAVAVDPSTGTAYVVNTGDGTVSVVDGTAHAVVATVPIGTQPTAIDVDPATHTVYVTSPDDGTVTIIDGRHNVVTTTANITRTVQAVAVDPATHTAYVGSGEGLFEGLLLVPGTQTIAFGSQPPSPAAPGTTYEVSAEGGPSAQPVVLGTTTPGVCTITGAVVSFVAVGTCTISADQAATPDYGAAPTVTQTVHVTATPTTVGSPTATTVTGSLAATGAGVTSSFLIAFVTIGAGAGLLVMGRRRPRCNS